MQLAFTGIFFIAGELPRKKLYASFLENRGRFQRVVDFTGYFISSRNAHETTLRWSLHTSSQRQKVAAHDQYFYITRPDFLFFLNVKFSSHFHNLQSCTVWHILNSGCLAKDSSTSSETPCKNGVSEYDISISLRFASYS